MFINPAFAQAAGDAVSSGSSLTGMIAQLVLIFAIFYFSPFYLKFNHNFTFDIAKFETFGFINCNN